MLIAVIVGKGLEEVITGLRLKFPKERFDSLNSTEPNEYFITSPFLCKTEDTFENIKLAREYRSCVARIKNNCLDL